MSKDIKLGGAQAGGLAFALKVGASQHLLDSFRQDRDSIGGVVGSARVDGNNRQS